MLEQSTTKRIALGLEYDGSNYHGWQSQNASLMTIQNVIEEALSRVANQPCKTFCAGRTDIGVHAIGQVIHFNTSVNRPIHAWIAGTNSYLSKDIRIHWAQEVPDDFHARFSATARHYRYIIHNSLYESALLRNRVFWYPWQLDAKSMQQAIAYLLGEHDFSAFRASSCQSLSTKRRLHIATVTKQNDFIVIDIKANAFLHHMVRNIIGTLLIIGRNRKSPLWIKELLASRDRTLAGVTAPSRGLYLVAVTYPLVYAIPALKKFENAVDEKTQSCTSTNIDFML